MTASNGPVLFNSLSGSDSQSSGLGPSVAVYGTAASTTASSAIVTGITTTGVSAGDLLWLESSSGRQFSIIASVDSATQVTCDDTFDNTESSRTWAIGGKRATFDNASSRSIFGEHGTEGLIIETETDQTLTSQISRSSWPTSAPYILIRGSGSTKKTITATGNFGILFQTEGSSSTMQNLKFVGSTNNSATATSGGHLNVLDCQYGDDGASTNFRIAVASNVYGGIANARQCVMYGQGASVSGGYGLRSTYYAASGAYGADCFIKDFYYGVYSNHRTTAIRRCVIVNAYRGLMGDRDVVYADNCIFHNITENAIHIDGLTTHKKWWPNVTGGNIFGRNIFSNVTGDVFWGNNNTTDGPDDYVTADALTCYLYNSSGFTGITFPTVTLTEDPFVDAANGDFNIKSSSVLAGVSYNNSEKTTRHPFRNFVSSNFQTTNNTMKTHPLG
jgi:hypothetical protein